MVDNLKHLLDGGRENKQGCQVAGRELWLKIKSICCMGRKGNKHGCQVHSRERVLL